jgi:hypothetical protein
MDFATWENRSDEQIVTEERIDVLRQAAKDLGLKPARTKKEIVEQIRQKLAEAPRRVEVARVERPNDVEEVQPRQQNQPREPVEQNQNLPGDLEQRIASVIGMEFGKMRKEFQDRESAMIEFIGNLGVSNASDSLWAPRLFSNGARQEFYNDLIKIGKLLSKLEAQMAPSKEEVLQAKKSVQLWMTRTILEEEAGSEFASMIGRGFESKYPSANCN